MPHPLPAVLFVCLGNICRSPLAEAAFRAEAARAGLKVLADSAGTGDWHVGSPPDPRARAVALEHGIDISGYRARQLTAADFLRFDQVLVMDHANLEAALRLVPTGARTRPRLLLDLVPGREGAAVADPYYGGEEHFADTWADVAMAAAALAGNLRV
jgi:protein-tyrosine phosphatase